jgi:hypothetical protein
MVGQITSSNIGVKAEYGGVTGLARSLVDVAWAQSWGNSDDFRGFPRHSLGLGQMSEVAATHHARSLRQLLSTNHYVSLRESLHTPYPARGDILPIASTLSGRIGRASRRLQIA